LDKKLLSELNTASYSPLDLLPQKDLREKLVELAIQGVPPGIHPDAHTVLVSLRKKLVGSEPEDAKVVIFGGGTGLSNILGGDSRQEDWPDSPFSGLKTIFPKTRSIVCITDNGGSTGELLKDLPLIAIGDIRHVLLSSIQLCNLQKKYSLDSVEAKKVVAIIAKLFNLRFTSPLERGNPKFAETISSLRKLPTPLENYLHYLIKSLFEDPRFDGTRTRPHCLGNLLCAAAIYREIPLVDSSNLIKVDSNTRDGAIAAGLNSLGIVLGCGEKAVLPCSFTPAQLRVLYANGVEITGEHKLGAVKRGVPIERVEVDYCDAPKVYPGTVQDIEDADIIMFAPGSLYSSIIPVLKVPGLAEAVRKNKKALKVLVSNLWVQEGETDFSNVDPARKFHVSDMLDAYEKNIPGGTDGLFKEILCVSLKDIPASILQRYAVEGKVPIYLDQDNLIQRNYFPVECDIFSKSALNQRGVIHHDPERLALAVNALYRGHYSFSMDDVAGESRASSTQSLRDEESIVFANSIYPCDKFAAIQARIDRLNITFVGSDMGNSPDRVKQHIAEILWDHPVVPLEHLDYFQNIHCLSPENWKRDQKWDKVFSYYDPEDGCIKIRTDQVGNRHSLEIAVMIALGESLLGNYAKSKMMEDVIADTLTLGRVYHLRLINQHKRECFFTDEELRRFLLIARMCPAKESHHYTRLINSGEGFTPPGLLMGLMYAWYIDNRLATHIEYKMSVLKINSSGLIPEQLKMASRRRNMIQFFRDVVFVRSQVTSEKI